VTAYSYLKDALISRASIALWLPPFLIMDETTQGPGPF
jgi:hypothetical protein